MEWKIKDFKHLSVEELYNILELRNKVFIVEEEYLYQDLDEKDINAFHLYCINENKIIVVLRILKKETSYSGIYIGRVAVDEEYRRLGLGKKAVEKAIKFIQYKYGKELVKVSVQVHVREFYKALGFKEVSDTYLEEDIPHIKMIKQI